MNFARWIFRIAGTLGLLILLPQYFLEQQIGRDQPPPITHPEFFYGFVGVGIAWQIVFIVISLDPPRFRPLMPAAMVEKFSFSVATFVLYGLERVAMPMVVAAALDFTLGVLFVASYFRCPASATGDL
jgi:hypothetical protein